MAGRKSKKNSKVVEICKCGWWIFCKPLKRNKFVIQVVPPKVMRMSSIFLVQEFCCMDKCIEGAVDFYDYLTYGSRKKDSYEKRYGNK